jgi:cell division protein FtsB
MNKIRQMLQNKTFVGALVVLLAFFTYGQVKNFRARHAVEKEIKELTRQSEILQKENQELESFVAYLQTDNFKERALREQLNLKKEGEVVFSFAPQNTPEVAGLSTVAEAQEVANEPNTAKWWNYFFKQDE